MANIRFLEEDKGININIATVTGTASYTANAAKSVVCDVSLYGVAGNGDYVMHVTRQVSGSASATVMLPKTTMAAASGETNIGGQSGFISCGNGDILIAYVDGLAGDTSVTGVHTRWWEFPSTEMETAIGTPIALDGGTATIAGMLTKFADDSSGSLYDATADSLHAIAGTVGNISIAGAPSYEAPTSYVLSTGTQTGGTYASVDTSNGVYHTHTDSGGLLDLYYQFTLAGDEIATSVIFKGRINSSNDNVNIQAYDWTTSSWSTLFTLVGTNVATDTSQSPALVGKYTGTGLNVGKVRIRIVNAVTLTTATLYVDQLIIGKTITSRTVGYQDGAVWIDTVNGSTGTVSWVNGTADNPVKTLAEAYTIASAVGLNAYVLAAGSSITLTQSAANTKFVGAATIDLNGQSIADAFFRDAYTINGASTGDDAEFVNCGIGSGTFYHAYFIECRFKGVTTFVANNEYIIIRGTDSNSRCA